MARSLAAAGFSTEPLGLVHGYLVQRWVQATPLPVASSFPRERLIEQVAGYLSHRGGLRPDDTDAPPLEALGRMAVHNTALADGAEAGGEVERLMKELGALEAERVPVAIDGRMHRWEWLVLGEGERIKTDALDHHCAHDASECRTLPGTSSAHRSSWR